MEIGQKGVFFTFLSLSLVMVMIVLFVGVPDIRIYNEADSVESQFISFNRFSRDLSESYIQSILKAQTYMAMRTILEEIDSTNQPRTDVQSDYRELMLYSTLGGVQQPMMKTNLSDWTSTMSQKSSEILKIRTNITFYDIRIEQTDPWHLTAIANASIETERKNMRYQINETFSANVTIKGLKDPVYLFNSSENRIFPREAFGAGQWYATTREWDDNTTLSMILNRRYRHSQLAPSFLMRLVNDTGNSTCCGIESLIDSSFGNTNRSYVDYLFFNNITICDHASLYNYTGISDQPDATGFKLDLEHELLYNLTANRSAIICWP